MTIFKLLELSIQQSSKLGGQLCSFASRPSSPGSLLQLSVSSAGVRSCSMGVGVPQALISPPLSACALHGISALHSHGSEVIMRYNSFKSLL